MKEIFDFLTENHSTTIIVDESGARIGIGTAVPSKPVARFEYKWFSGPSVEDAWNKAFAYRIRRG